MANLQNNLLVEVEELLDFYLNKKSMTNKQALKEIEKTEGSFSRELAEMIIKERERGVWFDFHRTNRSINSGE